MEIDEITSIIIQTSIKIHKELGPGLLESVYETVLAKMLADKGLHIERQKPVSFVYEGIRFNEGFRCDLLVENMVVIELKSTERLMPVHSKQLLTYLRLMDKEVGLLINFGAGKLKDGLERIVHHHIDNSKPTQALEQFEKEKCL
jgi:iron complex transport system substrate-binding protein